MLQVQERFEVDIKELPEQIDTSTYSKLVCLFVCICVVFTTHTGTFSANDRGE